MPMRRRRSRVPKRMMVILARNGNDRTRNALVYDRCERPTIVAGAIPVTIAIDVPIAFITVEVVVEVRDEVDLGLRYEHGFRRALEYHGGGRRHPDVDMHVHARAST